MTFVQQDGDWKVCSPGPHWVAAAVSRRISKCRLRATDCAATARAVAERNAMATPQLEFNPGVTVGAGVAAGPGVAARRRTLQRQSPIHASHPSTLVAHPRQSPTRVSRWSRAIAYVSGIRRPPIRGCANSYQHPENPPAPTTTMKIMVPGT